MSAEPQHPRRPAWRVVRAMERELKRQGAISGEGIDSMGRARPNGMAAHIDLAALAEVTVLALQREFGF